MGITHIVASETKDNSLFFKTRREGVHVYLELFFGDDMELIINIHRENVNPICFGGGIKETLKRLEKELTI